MPNAQSIRPQNHPQGRINAVFVQERAGYYFVLEIYQNRRE
jgi:hypothetical protein